MRGRGLKLDVDRCELRGIAVAPYAGAWIETCVTTRWQKPCCVAPYAGAWIETIDGVLMASSPGSPLMRGRGLKPAIRIWPGARQRRPLCGGVD